MLYLLKNKSVKWLSRWIQYVNYYHWIELPRGRMPVLTYTLALQVKYSTYYHLEFEEQKLWETAALYPWPCPAGYQFNLTCSVFAFRQETNDRENVNKWEEKHNKHRCISAGHERSLNGLVSMKNVSIIYCGPHSPQIWAEHLWEILEWLSTTAMKTPNEVIPFERMLVEIHIVE